MEEGIKPSSSKTWRVGPLSPPCSWLGWLLPCPAASRPAGAPPGGPFPRGRPPTSKKLLGRWKLCRCWPKGPPKAPLALAPGSSFHIG